MVLLLTSHLWTLEIQNAAGDIRDALSSKIQSVVRSHQIYTTFDNVLGVILSDFRRANMFTHIHRFKRSCFFSRHGR